MNIIRAVFLATAITVSACATTENAKPLEDLAIAAESNSSKVDDDSPHERPERPLWEGTCEGQKRNGERHYFITRLDMHNSVVAFEINKHIRENPNETHFPRIQNVK